MARYKIPYPGLSESLKHLRIQVIDSLPYTVKNLPKLNTPEEVFNYCKKHYKFKNDPPGVEFFQTVPTLINNNYEGDCDDATIFCLTELLNSGFTDIGICLAGRSKSQATHIYAYCDYNGQRNYLDLTNKKYNEIRPYAFKQYIPFKISKNQLDMFLQLADGGKHQQKNKPRLRKLTESEKQKAIFMPSKNVFVPVHRFDKQPIKKVKETLLSEGYDLNQVSTYLSGRAERKARRKQKAENKQLKFETKMEKKKAHNENIYARADVKRGRASKKVSTGEARKLRGEGKRLKGERGGGSGWDNFINGAKQLIPSGGDDSNDEELDNSNVVDTEAQDVTNDYQEPQDNQEEEQTDETELQEGFRDLGKADLLNAGLFALGFFLEKTKRVA